LRNAKVKAEKERLEAVAAKLKAIEDKERKAEEDARAAQEARRLKQEADQAAAAKAAAARAAEEARQIAEAATDAAADAEQKGRKQAAEAEAAQDAKNAAVKAVIEKTVVEMAESIFDEVDKDEDGKMTEKEFTAWAEHNLDKASMFFAFLDENDFRNAEVLSFQDKVGAFWMKAVFEFDDNVNMRLEKPEFCALYEKLATAPAKMQQACPIRVAPAIEKAAADTADSVFDEVDKDQDGKMTEEEFCTWAEHNQSKAGMFFAFLDEDDFQTGVSVTGEVLSFQDKVGAFWMKAVFEFDDNVNMRLEKPEFCALYEKLAAVPVVAQTAQSIFEEVDKDEDGKMTEKEFTTWAEHNRDKASMFFAFIDEARLEREGYVAFEDKVNTFWLNAVVEFDDNGNMRLEKPEFCALYEKLAAAKKIEIVQAPAIQVQRPAPEPEVHFVQAPAIKVRPAPESPSGGGAALYKQYAKAAKEGDRATSPAHAVDDEWSKMMGGQTEDHHLRPAEHSTPTKPSASIEVDVKLPGVEIEVSIKSPFS